MMSYRNLSIRSKQTLIIMFVCTVSLLVACGAFVAYDISLFRRQVVESMASLAEVVGNSATAAIDFDDPEVGVQILAALSGEPSIVLAHIHTRDGRLFAAYNRDGAQSPSEIPHSIETRSEFSAKYFHLFRPIVQRGEQLGTIEILADLDELKERLRRYAAIAVVVLSTSLLISFGLSIQLQKLISDPIRDLAEVARSVALERNYSVRAAKHSNDELGQLVDGFNEMLDQIQTRDSSLQASQDLLETRVENRTLALAKANEALQEVELRLAHAMAMAQLFAWDYDVAGGFFHFSDRYYLLHGTTAEREGGNRMSADDFARTFVHPDDAHLVADEFAKAAATTDPDFLAEFQSRILRRDGALRHVEVSMTCTKDAAGQTILIHGANQDITERKQAEEELAHLQKQLLETSRLGGMAEIATNVLHNVGNVLNSVNISTGVIVESVKRSRACSLARVVTLMQEHALDLGAFITTDARGKHLPAHLAQLSEHLAAEQEANIHELELLRRNVEHIKEIVAMQQTYAAVGGVKEMINVVDLVEDSLRMNEEALSRHRVELVRMFEAVPSLTVEKHKVIHILVNLIRNAKNACQDSERVDPRLTVSVANGDDRIRISVMDNGIGIPPENLTRVFNFGFTTRKDGHGFGLHGGALAAKELGGALTVQSAGIGQGATFTLELPIAPKDVAV